MKRGARSFGKQRGRDCEQRVHATRPERRNAKGKGEKKKTEREKERMKPLGAHIRLAMRRAVVTDSFAQTRPSSCSHRVSAKGNKERKATKRARVSRKNH